MPSLEVVDLQDVPQFLLDLRMIAPWLLTVVVAIFGVRFAGPPLLDGLANVIRALKGK